MNQIRPAFRWSFVVAMCLAMLLPSLMQNASAQPLCLGNTVWDAEAEACVDADGTPTTDEIPVEEPAEEPATEPTMEATEPGNAELTAPSEFIRIVVYQIYCDGTRDVRAYAAANPDEYVLCPGRTINQTINGYAAHEGSHWGTYSLNEVVSSFTGYLGGLQNVPRGRWTITSDTAGGYNVAPVPVCYLQNFVPNQAVTKSPNVIPTVDSTTGAFDLPANTDQTDVVCWVHYMPTTTGATVDIVVFVCPADIENFHFRSVDSRRLACNEPIPAMDFAMQEFRGIHRTTTIDPPENVASFPAVLNGFVDIISSVPEGYGQPFAYCETRSPDGTRLKLYSYVAPISTGAIRYEILTPTGKMYCDWFLVPIEVEGSDPLALAGDATPDAEERDPAVETASLTVQRWECPPGVSSGDYGDLLEGCSEAGEAGDFSVEIDADEVPVTVDGGMLIGSLPSSGTITISGEQPLAVYCSTVESTNGVTIEQFPETIPVSGEVITLNIAADTTIVYCDWFTQT